MTEAESSYRNVVILYLNFVYWTVRDLKLHASINYRDVYARRFRPKIRKTRMTVYAADCVMAVHHALPLRHAATKATVRCLIWAECETILAFVCMSLYGRHHFQFNGSG
jgi:hypothetical protein